MMDRARVLLVAAPDAPIRVFEERLQDPDLLIVPCATAKAALDVAPRPGLAIGYVGLVFGIAGASLAGAGVTFSGFAIMVLVGLSSILGARRGCSAARRSGRIG